MPDLVRPSDISGLSRSPVLLHLGLEGYPMNRRSSMSFVRKQINLQTDLEDLLQSKPDVATAW